jgi:hypothetical protein
MREDGEASEKSRTIAGVAALDMREFVVLPSNAPSRKLVAEQS